MLDPEFEHAKISIHAPRRGSDEQPRTTRYLVTRFQSTLPAGGATIAETISFTVSSDYNPLSPKGKRQFNGIIPSPDKAFQSTLPAGGATQVKRNHSIT